MTAALFPGAAELCVTMLCGGMTGLFWSSREGLSPARRALLLLLGGGLILISLVISIIARP